MSKPEIEEHTGFNSLAQEIGFSAPPILAQVADRPAFADRGCPTPDDR